SPAAVASCIRTQAAGGPAVAHIGRAANMRRLANQSRPDNSPRTIHAPAGLAPIQHTERSAARAALSPSDSLLALLARHEPAARRPNRCIEDRLAPQARSLTGSPLPEIVASRAVVLATLTRHIAGRLAPEPALAERPAGRIMVQAVRPRIAPALADSSRPAAALACAAVVRAPADGKPAGGRARAGSEQPAPAAVGNGVAKLVPALAGWGLLLTPRSDPLRSRSAQAADRRVR